MKVLSISIAAYNVAYTLKECLDPFLKSNVLGELDIMVAVSYTHLTLPTKLEV